MSTIGDTQKGPRTSVAKATLGYLRLRWAALKRAVDRILSLNYWQQLMWLTVGFVVVMALFIGILWLTGQREGKEISTIFLILTDPGNSADVLDGIESPAMAAFYALIVVVGAVLFGGILVSLFSNMIERRVENFLGGNVNYDMDGHLVVIGYDAMLPQLVRQLCTTYPRQDVLLLTRKDTGEVRETLSTLLSEEEMKRVVLYCGQRDSLSDLEKLCVDRAAEIFIIGNRYSHDHDALNVDCLTKLVDILRNHYESHGQKEVDVEQKKVINILLENHATHAVLQTTDLAQTWNKWVRVIPFSFYEDWARQVLADDPKYPHIVIRRDSADWANIVVFGMSNMGLTLATEAAHSLHFSRLPDGQTRRTRITMISPKADEEMQLFRTRYRQVFEIQSALYAAPQPAEGGELKWTQLPPTLFSGTEAEFLDIDFEFIKCSGNDERVHQMLASRLADGSCHMAVYICTGSDDGDMNIGLYLPEAVHRNADIFIRQKHTGQLLDLLRMLNTNTGQQEGECGRYSRIYPFGMLTGNFDLSHRTQRMGILINFFFCCSDDKEKYAHTFESSHVLTQQEWHDALKLWNDKTSVADQWSSFYCCHNFSQKLEQLGMTTLDKEHIDEIERLIDEHIGELSFIEHSRWNMEKLLLGFRKPNDAEQALLDHCRLKTDQPKREYKRLKGVNHHVHDYLRSYDGLLGHGWPGDPADSIQKIDEKMLRQIPWVLRNA